MSETPTLADAKNQHGRHLALYLELRQDDPDFEQKRDALAFFIAMDIDIVREMEDATP